MNLLRRCLLCALLLLIVSHQLQAGEATGQRTREPYRVFLRATRTSDHAVLLAVSAPVVLGQRTTARTDSTQPAENHPAFPSFKATLNRTANPGEYELVTVLAVRQVRRNRKGQIKREKRNLGSLLPVRLGEAQIATPPEDPVTLEVRVERE